jgi:RNA polymerase sigma factor (sigma-70 family)
LEADGKSYRIFNFMNKEQTVLAKADGVPETDFRELISRVSEGSEEAAWEIIDKHGDAIFRAVRRSLNSRMRQRFDSADFVQLVWKSFFHKRAGFERFSTPEEMAAFLVGMARNKVAMEARRCLVRPTANMNRERYLDDSSENVGACLRSPDPDPSDVAIARERYEQFLQDKPEHYQQIIKLSMGGHKQRDIAIQVGVDERTVRRVLNKLCQENGQ